jgi:2-hydroxyglutarate dehydrogenase
VAFEREGYKFTDLSVSHLWRLATNVALWKFAAANFDLAVTEMYRDLNKAAFMNQARKLVPSVTDDMVESSFVGVMSQILGEDGKPAKDFIYERNMLGGTTLHVRVY